MQVGAAETLVRGLRGRIPDERLVLAPHPDPALPGAPHRPAVLVRCRHTADVRLAVRAAREAGLPLSVLGRGRDRADRSPAAGGLVVDVRDLRAVAVDPGTATARVGGGASSLDVAAASAPHGLVPVTGWRGDAGLVGLSLGGGCGPLAGRAGLAADNLLGALVVLADGTCVDTDEHPDLLRVLRGGVGAGVVVQARLALHPVPVLVGGTSVFAWSRARTVLTGLSDLLRSAPDELTVRSGVRWDRSGRPVVVVQPVWSGDPAAWMGRPGPVPELAALGTPLSSDVAPLTLTSLLTDEDRAHPAPGAPRHELVRTRALERVDAPVVQAVREAGDALTSPRSRVWLHHVHGAADPLDPASPAASRRPPLVAEVVAGWDGTGRGAVHRAWADRVDARLSWTAPWAGGTDPRGPHVARLVALGARYDPDGAFRTAPPPAPGPPQPVCRLEADQEAG